MSIRTDLENHVRESYDLVQQYESIIQVSDHPTEKARSKREIERQQQLIQGYLRDYQRILQMGGGKPPDDIQDIAASVGIRFTNTGPGNDSGGSGAGTGQPETEKQLASLHKQLLTARQVLNLLEEQLAVFPFGSQPPHLLLQIQQQQSLVSQLEHAIDDLHRPV